MSDLGIMIGGVLTVLGGLLLLGFLFSYPLMLLWNGCLVDAVTVVKPVTWLQMWGLSVLISVLFKGTGISKKS